MTSAKADQTQWCRTLVQSALTTFGLNLEDAFAQLGCQKAWAEKTRKGIVNCKL